MVVPNNRWTIGFFPRKIIQCVVFFKGVYTTISRNTQKRLPLRIFETPTKNQYQTCLWLMMPSPSNQNGQNWHNDTIPPILMVQCKKGLYVHLVATTLKHRDLLKWTVIVGERVQPVIMYYYGRKDLTSRGVAFGKGGLVTRIAMMVVVRNTIHGSEILRENQLGVGSWGWNPMIYKVFRVHPKGVLTGFLKHVQ